jgi:cyanuric acid amidohydrolase
MKVKALRFDTRSPSDVEPLRRALDAGELRAEDIRCIIGKTEGNGGRNDFTRELAVRAFADLLAHRLGIMPAAIEDRVVLSFSGGVEGVVTPHVVVFACEGAPCEEPRPKKRLALGVGHTRPFRPEEIGRMPQIEETARVIREIADRIRIDSPWDIHLVQMKGALPSYTYEEAQAARRAGMRLRCDMAFSRGASALGAALATGEVGFDALSDEIICEDFSLWSSTASCSAKPGLARTEIVVFGMSSFWEGDLSIHHGVLKDIIDARSVRAIAEPLGLTLEPPPSAPIEDRLVAAFAKAEADPRGTIRGHRHAMLTDDDLADTRQARAALAAVIAAVLGDTRIYVSTRAEHHGPLGGGPLALIARDPG